MPKETRNTSGSLHQSRVYPYPSRSLSSTTTQASNDRVLASSSASDSTWATSSSTLHTSTMDSLDSSPPPHHTDSMINPAFTMTSPGTERASTAWAEEDDAKLMMLRAKNMNWIAIAQHFSGKTGNACRKRHERLVEKRNAQGWDSVRLSDLATAYMDCRETMWRMVADRCGGEKWQTIEQKCMEKGFKTLSSAARASRRHTGSLSVPVHPNALGGSPEPSYDDGSMPPAFRDSGFYEPPPYEKMNGQTSSYNYHFGTQPAQEASYLAYAAPHTATHSRRASAAHSISHGSVDHHSSRSNSHGPSTMAPPVANNPFASPQPYYTDPVLTSMPPAMSSNGTAASYPGATRSIHSGHNVLPSISNNLLDTPSLSRLPSIIGTQG